tara:strand:+ start:487 stop:771 length:285 start_codon:yes stop_codon:yes gene_type:complete
MLVELVELQQRINGTYVLNTIYLNPKHIIYISEDRHYGQLAEQNKLNLGLVKGATFSRIKINQNNNVNEITVVGDPASIEHKIFKKTSRTLLRG